MKIDMNNSKDRAVIWKIMYDKSTLNMVPSDRNVPDKKYIPFNLKK